MVQSGRQHRTAVASVEPGPRKDLVEVSRLRETSPLLTSGSTRWSQRSEIPTEHLSDSWGSRSGSLVGDLLRKTGLLGLTRQQGLTLLNLSVGSLLAGCCIANMVPFFPKEAQRRGVSETVSGAVYSCYALTQLLMFPLQGRIVPWLGVSRHYNLGLLLAGAATLVFGLLVYIQDATAFIAACFITRIVEATGTAAMLTACRTLIVGMFPERSTTALGVVETVTGVGLALGPGMGGGLYQLWGYGAPFYVLGGAMLLISVLSLTLAPRVAVPEQRRQRYSGTARVFFSSLENWLGVCVVLTVAVNWTALDPHLEPYVSAVLGLQPAQLSVFFLFAAAVYSVASVFWGYLCDRVSNPYLVMAPCLAAAGLGVLLIPPSPLLGLPPARWLLALGMLVRQTFQGGTYLPVLSRMMAACVRRGLPDSVATQAFVASVFGAVFSLGYVLGPVVGGLITDAAGFPTVATCVAGLNCVVCLMVAARAAITQAKLRRADRPTPGGDPSDYDPLPTTHHYPYSRTEQHLDALWNSETPYRNNVV